MRGATNMYYLDYRWDLTQNGINLDEDLNTFKLGWTHGDYFRFERDPVTCKQRLVRVDPIEKFLIDGAKKNNV